MVSNGIMTVTARNGSTAMANIADNMLTTETLGACIARGQPIEPAPGRNVNLETWWHALTGTCFGSP